MDVISRNREIAREYNYSVLLRGDFNHDLLIIYRLLAVVHDPECLMWHEPCTWNQEEMWPVGANGRRQLLTLAVQLIVEVRLEATDGGSSAYEVTLRSFER